MWHMRGWFCPEQQGEGTPPLTLPLPPPRVTLTVTAPSLRDCALSDCVQLSKNLRWVGGKLFF